MKKWEKPLVQELDLCKTMYDISIVSQGKPTLRCPSCCETYIWNGGNDYYCKNNPLVKADGNGQTFYCQFPGCPGDGKALLQSDLIQCS